MMMFWIEAPMRTGQARGGFRSASATADTPTGISALMSYG
jgi:hypothetical protein